MHLDRLALPLEPDVGCDLRPLERRSRRLEGLRARDQRQLASRARETEDHAAAHAGERQRPPPDVGQVDPHRARARGERLEMEQSHHPDDAPVVRRVVVDARPAAARSPERHEPGDDEQLAFLDEVESDPRPGRDVGERVRRAGGEGHSHSGHEARDVLVVDGDLARGRVDAHDIALSMVGRAVAAGDERAEDGGDG